MRTRPARREPLALLGLIVVGLVISGLEPADRLTWLLEVAPVLAGLLVLIGTYRRFPLTPLSYRLVFLLSLLLLVGADAFLATQGDPWDTQWDMFLTFLGATTALLLLSRRHERELMRLGAAR